MGLDSDALSQSEGLPEGPAQPTPDPDSFSDSYTHITPSPEEPPASLLSTETLGGGEFTQEEEDLVPKETVYPLNGEELQHEAEESDLLSRTPDLGKQAGTNDKLQSSHNLCICLDPLLYFTIKWRVLFVFEVYLVDQLVMEMFSIWARRLSGEAVVGMRQGA